MVRIIIFHFISGALKHLCVLRILLLHNNQLKKLGKTVKELKGMISLQTLSNTLFYFAEQRTVVFLVFLTKMFLVCFLIIYQ